MLCAQGFFLLLTVPKLLGNVFFFQLQTFVYAQPHARCRTMSRR